MKTDVRERERALSKMVPAASPRGASRTALRLMPMAMPSALVPVVPSVVRAARVVAPAVRTTVVQVGRASGSRQAGTMAVTVKGSVPVRLAAVDRFVTPRTLAALVGKRHDVVLRVHADGSFEPLDDRAVIDTMDVTQQFVIGPLTLYS